MELAERVNAALQLEKLNLPPKPKVVRLEWEPFEDWYGDESLKIWLILSDETTDDELAGGIGIRAEISRALKQQGVDLFPFIHFAKESEYAELQKGV